MNKEECMKCKHNRNCFIRSTVGDNTCLKLKEQDQEIDRLNNIINELNEDIPCLLEIINRNEKDIKIYQDEWIAVRSTEERLKELKENNKDVR